MPCCTLPISHSLVFGETYASYHQGGVGISILSQQACVLNTVIHVCVWPVCGNAITPPILLTWSTIIVCGINFLIVSWVRFVASWNAHLFVSGCLWVAVCSSGSCMSGCVAALCNVSLYLYVSLATFWRLRQILPYITAPKMNPLMVWQYFFAIASDIGLNNYTLSVQLLFFFFSLLL